MFKYLKEMKKEKLFRKDNMWLQKSRQENEQIRHLGMKKT